MLLVFDQMRESESTIGVATHICGAFVKAGYCKYRVGHICASLPDEETSLTKD